MQPYSALRSSKVGTAIDDAVNEERIVNRYSPEVESINMIPLVMKTNIE